MPLHDPYRCGERRRILVPLLPVRIQAQAQTVTRLLDENQRLTAELAEYKTALSECRRALDNLCHAVSERQAAEAEVEMLRKQRDAMTMWPHERGRLH